MPQESEPLIEYGSVKRVLSVYVLFGFWVLFFFVFVFISLLSFEALLMQDNTSLVSTERPLSKELFIDLMVWEVLYWTNNPEGGGGLLNVVVNGEKCVQA